MNTRRISCVLVLLVTAGLGLMGPAAAQEESTPADIQALVDGGYLPSADGSVVARNDQERIDLSGEDNQIQWTWAVGKDNHTSFVLKTTVAWGPGDPEDACGFIFRQRDEDDFYVVLIDRNGKITFDRLEDNRWQTDTVVSGRGSINTDAQGSNGLLLLASETSFEVFINDQHAARFHDTTYDTGQVALAMVTYEHSDATDCLFQDTWLWEPTRTPLGQPAAGRPASGSASTVQLTAYDAPVREAISELESLGIVPVGGSEIFREPYAFFEGTGNWFTPLASHRPFTHIVMAGTLNLRAGNTSAVETCGLLARIVQGSTSTASTFLEVALDNAGRLFVADTVDGETTTLHQATGEVELGVPHHLLFTLLRDKVTVYLDGRGVLQDVPVQERAGTYGIALRSKDANARCEGTNIWAWEVDQVVNFGDQCGVRAAGTVNLRSGPATSFERAGMLEAGQTAIVTGQATDGEGFVWWQLESGSWVRSDVVSTGGNCTHVPQVTP
ncbi:MAG TPA: SH3 domain-containing protein [Aggregatilineaceae bacterium]|nr:SH3 domain-containing protein [Aggregatilineaceae bacterium]